VFGCQPIACAVAILGILAATTLYRNVIGSMDTQRLIAFIVFSFSILLLWDAWQKENQPQVPQTAVISPSQQIPTPTYSATSGKTPQAVIEVEKSALLVKGARVKVVTDTLLAEIDTNGGDIRRLELLKHRDTVDEKKNLVLFDDKASGEYVAQSGLIGNGLPSHKAVFQAERAEYVLAPNASEIKATLSWTSPDGLVKVAKNYVFHRDSYLMDVSFDITNNGAAAIEPSAYFQLLRNGNPPAGSPKFVSTYTGAAIYSDKGKFEKIPFADIEKGKEKYTKFGEDGWVAMLQHYYLSAWLPKKNGHREFYARKAGEGLYDVGTILPLGTIRPGETKTMAVPLYAGPQEQDKLNSLAPGLGLTVDYGWLTIIAAPIFWALSFIHKSVSNWGVSIILLTVFLKLLFFPLSAKSYRSMAQMKLLAPKLQKLKEHYGDDRQKLHQAMMELYKTEKVNPLGGCLPIVIQIPVFIALYWVLLASVEIRHAPFIFWIHDLSSPDPFYVLPIVMGITMIIQTKLNPTPPDPIQAKVMMIMPLAFSIFFFFFASGLVLYWVVNNVLSITQQWAITRSMGSAKVAHAKH
jgi:YidC/Oxa1 family membrane protein insertase